MNAAVVFCLVPSMEIFRLNHRGTEGTEKRLAWGKVLTDVFGVNCIYELGRVLVARMPARIHALHTPLREFSVPLCLCG